MVPGTPTMGNPGPPFVIFHIRENDKKRNPGPMGVHGASTEKTPKRDLIILIDGLVCANAAHDDVVSFGGFWQPIPLGLDGQQWR